MEHLPTTSLVKRMFLGEQVIIKLSDQIYVIKHFMGHLQMFLLEPLPTNLQIDLNIDASGVPNNLHRLNVMCSLMRDFPFTLRPRNVKPYSAIIDTTQETITIQCPPSIQYRSQYLSLTDDKTFLFRSNMVGLFF